MLFLFSVCAKQGLPSASWRASGSGPPLCTANSRPLSVPMNASTGDLDVVTFPSTHRLRERHNTCLLCDSLDLFVVEELKCTFLVSVLICAGTSLRMPSSTKPPPLPQQVELPLRHHQEDTQVGLVGQLDKLSR